MAPRPEVRKYVRNQSSRNGRRPTVIVLHSTESHNRPGLSDLQGLAGWFDNPSAQASSHVANDAEGNDARYVHDSRKAWTQASYNPQALSIEQIGHASQRSWPDKQIHNTAAWIAYWSKKYDIPIRHSKFNGVCLHSDLGALGGGHHDPGEPYPLAKVLTLARQKTRTVDVRKETIWKRRLAEERSRLRSLLALRARWRQLELVEKDARYLKSTQKLRALRTRITKLKNLLNREKNK